MTFNSDIFNVLTKLSSKKFQVKIYTEVNETVYDLKENREMIYLELGVYLLTHNIKRIEIIEQNET